MARSRIGRVAFFLCGASVLAACENGNGFNFGGGPGGDAEVSLTDTGDASAVRRVERDVEAPEVFQAEDQGLWDGRPSLGGVWVAYPDVTEPERVIIRNQESGKFVIGALFKRERNNPGPKFQVSSDAASALGMLAGAPDKLMVTALRRQQVALSNEAVDGEEALPSPGQVQTATLDPIAAAGDALNALEANEQSASQVALATPAPSAPAPQPSPSRLAKPFIQIGFFSVEQNASNTGTALRTAGIVPNIQTTQSAGKTYYRVTVGPAPNSAERAALLKKVKGLGYSDAYFVSK